MKFNEKLEALLKSIDKFTDKQGVLLKQNIKDASEKFDSDLIQLLFNDNHTKAHFFNQIGGATVFNYRKFIDYIEDKNFLIDSYTKFSNKVGLTISNKHIQQMSEVVLSFPFKDCVLEGGQSKDDEKRKEIFFNEILAKDEINRLLDKKVITNAKKYTQDGISNEVKFNRDESGLIKNNLIIKGNNLLALHSLKSNFAGKVKLIYIDPPYNTGNDSFNYNDNFNHSTWLTFMKNRLEVARDLLSDDGVIFVQCDDNEQAYLKVLMDEVFGRNNFVNNIVWRKTDNQANIGNMARVKEYVLFFSKEFNNLDLNKIELSEKAKKEYRYKDDIGKFRRAILLDKTRGTHKYEVKTKTGKILNGPWMIKENDFWKLEKNNGIYWTAGGDEQPYGKIYLKESKGQISNDFWGIELGSNQQGAIHMQELFKERKFAFPKPETLLQRIIKISTQKGDLVLDYHLGSGTTCAVAHKMGRQYIGIEQMDYIEDIAVKRMQKVIGKTVKKDGELLKSVDFDNGGISKSVNWTGGSEFIYFELDKDNQKYIDKLSSATDKTILKLYDEIIEKAFLNYDVEVKKLKQEKDAFKTLTLSQQQEFLISILNKNQLYKNLSEIDDKDLKVDDKIKQLNKDFYRGK